jgi:hypothetical protein
MNEAHFTAISGVLLAKMQGNQLLQGILQNFGRLGKVGFKG